jgi:hypothetical protein
MAFSMNYVSFGQFIAPLASVNTTLLAESCGPSCLQYFTNYFGVNSTWAPPSSAFSMDPLMGALTSPSCASGQSLLWELLFYSTDRAKGGVISTSLVYLAHAIVPPGPDTYQNVTELLYDVDYRPDILAK